MLERNFAPGSFAALALEAAPARFAHTPAPQPARRAAEARPVQQHAADRSAAADGTAAEAGDLQLGAWLAVAGRQEEGPPMIVVSSLAT